MTDWVKDELKLKENHTWRAPNGYRIFVADRGAVRFNIPEGWVIEPDADSIKFYDAKPPDDNCRLACSYLRLPPQVDWSSLPLADLINVALNGDEREPQRAGEITHKQRADLEVAWADYTFTDPVLKRLAYTRLCIARGSLIQALITFEYWPEDAARLAAVWAEVIRSLQLGRYVQDPTVGDVLH